MPTLFFYFFAILAISGAVALVVFRNPVSSALSMVASFVGFAGLFIGLNAYFIGVIQILVYAGAIMVLFIFIIMLLDLKKEESKKFPITTVIGALLIPGLFMLQLVGIFGNFDDKKHQALDLPASAEHYQEEAPKIAATLSGANGEAPSLPDVNLIGQKLFTEFNFPFQVMGILLLVATIGVVVLSKRSPSTSASDQ